jgi:hypothetical protein
MVMMTLLAIVPHGRLLDQRERLLHRRRGVGGAELHRLLALELDRVDGPDLLGTGERAPWMALAPMPPTPTTATVSPGHLGGVHRRAPAGDHAAAEQAGLVERDVLLDLDAARLVDHGVVGERAEQAHQAEVLALGVVAGRAVGDLETEPHGARGRRGSGDRWSTTGSARTTG